MSPSGSTPSIRAAMAFTTWSMPAGGTENRRQRPRPPVRPRPIAVRAERRALDPPDRRLFAAQRILLRRRLCRHARDVRSDPGRARRFRGPAARRRRLAGRQPHHRRADQPRRHHPVARRSRSTATARAHPGTTYRGRDHRLGRLAAGRLGSGRRDDDLDHRLSRLQVYRRPTPTIPMSTSCGATTTTTRSAISRPSPRKSASRARPSAASSTGWSAAIMPARTCTSATICSSAANMAPLPPAAWSRPSIPIRSCATRRLPGCLSTAASARGDRQRSPARLGAAGR